MLIELEKRKEPSQAMLYLTPGYRGAGDNARGRHPLLADRT